MSRSLAIIEAESPRKLIKRLSKTAGAFPVQVSYRRFNGQAGSFTVPFRWVVDVYEGNPSEYLEGVEDPQEISADDWNGMHEVIMLSIPEGDYGREIDDSEFVAPEEIVGVNVASWSYKTDKDQVIEALDKAWRALYAAKGEPYDD